MVALLVLPRLLLLSALLYSTHAINDIDIALQKRQNFPIGTGVTPSPTPASSSSPSTASAASSDASPSATSAAPSSTSPQASVATTSVPASQTSPTSDSQPASASNAQNTNSASSAPESESSKSTSVSGDGPSITSGTTASGKTTPTPSKSVISRTQQVVTTIRTVSGSRTLEQVLTTSAVVPVSTSTSTPGLRDGGSSSNSSGLSTSSKRIIGGVIGGVGGAILLGGLAVVAWRIWGRKRQAGDDDRDLMDSHPGSSGHEKTSSFNGNSPFKSTLDQYHTPHSPPGPVNTASNF